MTKSENNPYSYEENEKLSAEIEKILSDKTSESVKIKKLRGLEAKVCAPISKRHIKYYSDKMIADRRSRLCRFICAVFVTAYLIFTLNRIFWYYNPEYNPFTSSFGIKITDIIPYLYLIPVIMIVYYLIRRFKS